MFLIDNCILEKYLGLHFLFLSSKLSISEDNLYLSTSKNVPASISFR